MAHGAKIITFFLGNSPFKFPILGFFMSLDPAEDEFTIKIRQYPNLKDFYTKQRLKKYGSKPRPPELFLYMIFDSFPPKGQVVVRSFTTSINNLSLNDIFERPQVEAFLNSEYGKNKCVGNPMLKRMRRLDILIHEVISDPQDLFNVVMPRNTLFSAYSYGKQKMLPKETSLQPGMVLVEVDP